MDSRLQLSLTGNFKTSTGNINKNTPITCFVLLILISQFYDAKFRNCVAPEPVPLESKKDYTADCYVCVSYVSRNLYFELFYLNEFSIVTYLVLFHAAITITLCRFLFIYCKFPTVCLLYYWPLVSLLSICCRVMRPNWPNMKTT